MTEYQVRTRLYDPPEAVRRLESKLACWKIASAPRMRGEDLRRAFEIFTELGAAPAAANVRRRLQQRGLSVPARRAPRATTAAHPAGLTAREAEVLEVLQEGLTNAQIAQRLYLSPRTVDHHVSSILGKLGVSNRADAVSMAGSLPGAGAGR